MTATHRPTNESPAARPTADRHPWTVAIVLLTLFYAVAIPVILLNLGAHSRGAADQNDWHLPVIRQFMTQWPRLDLADYASSTTPGYHLLVATAGWFTSPSLDALRLIGSIFTAGLLLTLGLWVGRRMRPVAAIIVCLPVLCSIYVFSSGAYLLPDNAGWWAVLGVMLIALRQKVDRWTFLTGAFVLLLTVLIRQINLWTAAPLLAAAIAGCDQPQNSPRSGRIEGPPPDPAILHKSKFTDPLARLVLMLLAILPAILVLLWFRHVWNGNLVPPNQRLYTTGGNAAALAVILSITAGIGVFFGGYLLPGLRRPWIIIAGACAGIIAGALPRTTYDVAARRFSGVWNAVPHFPYILGGTRSPLIILLSGLGGAVVVAWLCALPRRPRIIWAAAGLAFVAAQLTSANPWQRYYEPFILIAAALSAPAIANEWPQKIPRWSILGPLFLAIACATITAVGLRH